MLGPEIDGILYSWRIEFIGGIRSDSQYDAGGLHRHVISEHTNTAIICAYPANLSGGGRGPIEPIPHIFTLKINVLSRMPKGPRIFPKSLIWKGHILNRVN